MSHSIIRKHFVRIIAVLAVVVFVGACRPSEDGPAKPQPGSEQPATEEPEDVATQPEAVAEPKEPAEPTPQPEEPAEEPKTSPKAEPKEPVEPTTMPKAEPKEPAAEETTMVPEEPETEEPEAEPAEKPVDLGPPLVDDPAGLKKLDPAYPTWIDPKNKQVVMVGQVCQRETPLEMFACIKATKEHESVVVIDTKAYLAHAGLLAIGAKVGKPVQFDPEYVPATGTEIEVTLIWKDDKGQIQRARGQDWIRDVKTKKSMAQAWVFAGSGFWTDESTGEKRYQAEGGDFICVSNFPSATLDLPIKSGQANSALLFECFTERIPARGTPVTIVLKPKAGEQPKAE